MCVPSQENESALAGSIERPPYASILHMYIVCTALIPVDLSIMHIVVTFSLSIYIYSRQAQSMDSRPESTFIVYPPSRSIQLPAQLHGSLVGGFSGSNTRNTKVYMYAGMCPHWFSTNYLLRLVYNLSNLRKHKSTTSSTPWNSMT